MGRAQRLRPVPGVQRLGWRPRAAGLRFLQEPLTL